MKNSTKKSLKASNGITLIALVITISSTMRLQKFKEVIFMARIYSDEEKRLHLDKYKVSGKCKTEYARENDIREVSDQRNGVLKTSC